MNDAEGARARRFAERIRSLRITSGRDSICGRVKEAAVPTIAAAITANYLTTDLDDEQLRRVIGIHQSRHPQAFHTPTSKTET